MCERSLELANTVLCSRPDSLQLLLEASAVPIIVDTVRSHLRGLQAAVAEGALPEPGGPSLEADTVGSPAAEAALRLMQVGHMA